MSKFDYNELYELLSNMEHVRNLTELSERLYCSVSKCSKTINLYESKLKIQLYVKNEKYILSESGKSLLNQIEEPILHLKDITKIEHDTIGIDENLIEEMDSYFKGKNKQYSETEELIKLYNCGKLDKIIISSDFENELNFNSKELITQKPIYRIQKKGNTSDHLFANAKWCPIRKKLEVNGIKIDETLKQSVAICKMVRLGMGKGYTFSVDTLDASEIKIEKIEEFAISFFLYSKY